MLVKKYIYIAFVLCVITFFSSCTREEEYGSAVDADTVSIGFTTRAAGDGVTYDKLRFIAFNATTGKCVLNSTNSSITEVGGAFKIALKSGGYDFYVIANELSTITASLDAVATAADISAIEVTCSTPFRESDVMLIQKRSIWVKGIAGSDQGSVSTDGGQSYPSSEFSMDMERIHAKSSLTVTKKTTDAGDKLVITKVELQNVPTSSWLVASNYTGSNFTTQTIYENNIGTTISDNNVTQTIVAAIPDAASPSNQFPEYLLPNPTDATNAVNYVITAKYITSKGLSFDVYYKFPLRENLSLDNYNLKRNINYTVDLTITKKGESDAVQIGYGIKDWEGKSLNVDIDKDPFLDVTNVETDVYDAAATRVYFYSNQPTVNIKENLTQGADGIQLKVKDYFYDIYDDGGATRPQNFVYTYDPVTKLGEGYVDFVNLNTDLRNTVKRTVTLRAGILERNITLNCIISAESAKKNPTVYVGTFHRNNQTGERIVTWYAKGAWKARIMTEETALTSAIDKLRIDHFASPAFHEANLYSDSPTDAEGSVVTDGITEVSGYGRVYFRVGWDDYSTPNSQHHARIEVKYHETEGGEEKTAYLYCRQGEEPDKVTAESIRFATYNIDTPNRFVKYPTLSGYLYQWSRNTPWSVTGIINNYPTDHEQTYNTALNTCPDKYDFPNKAAMDQMELTMTNATYKWGYYADGYFDRRAVDPTQHIVTGPAGEMATAGGLFFLPRTAVGIFLPTAGWRNTGGTLEPSSLGRFGHYWSAVADPTNPTSFSQALHLTQNKTDNPNVLEYISRNDAMNVRCMRLEGNTITFDANGGLTTVRSITALEGVEVTLPNGIKHSNASNAFIGWAEGVEPTDKSYKAGEKILMFGADKTLYAVFATNVFTLEGDQVGTIDNSYADYVEGANGIMYATFAEAMAGEKAYPVLQVGPELGVLDWSTAMTTCRSKGEGWRLPRATEIHYLYKMQPSLFPGYYYYTGTESSQTQIGDDGETPEYTVFTLIHGSGVGVFRRYGVSIRCVKEL